MARDARPVFLDLVICATCNGCGEVVAAAEPHVVYTRIVESHHAPNVVRLHDGDAVLAYHAMCEVRLRPAASPGRVR